MIAHPFHCRRHCAPLVLFVLLASPCLADDFGDFRIPANHYVDWTGGLSGTGSWGHRNAGPDHFSNADVRGDLSTALSRWSENDTRTSAWNGYLQAAGGRREVDSSRLYPGGPTNTFDSYTSTDRSNQSLEGGSLSMQQSWYPGGGRWALVGSLGTFLGDNQEWERTREWRVRGLDPLEPFGSLSSSVIRSYRSSLSASAGVGYGRIRNATGIFEARVLEDRLRGCGALGRPLSAAARQRLANLMYARNDVSHQTTRPAAAVMDAVERILYEDGALRDSVLNAYELFRVTDPIFDRYFSAYDLPSDGLPRAPFARMTGWRVNVSLGTSHERFTTRYDFAATTLQYSGGLPEPPIESRGSYQLRQVQDDTRADISAEWHRPAGLRAQWDAAMSGEFPLTRQVRGERVSGRLGWEYIVADRWLAGASANHQRTMERDDKRATLEDSWDFSAATSVQYLVVDHVALGLTCSQGWSKRRSDFRFTNYADPRAAQSSNGGSVSLNIAYRFTGSAGIAGVYPATVMH